MDQINTFLRELHIYLVECLDFVINQIFWVTVFFYSSSDNKFSSSNRLMPLFIRTVNNLFKIDRYLAVIQNLLVHFNIRIQYLELQLVVWAVMDKILQLSMSHLFCFKPKYKHKRLNQVWFSASIRSYDSTETFVKRSNLLNTSVRLEIFKLDFSNNKSWSLIHYFYQNLNK